MFFVRMNPCQVLTYERAIGGGRRASRQSWWDASSSHFEVLAGIGRTRDLQSLEHEVEPMVPALKQKVARQGL